MNMQKHGGRHTDPNLNTRSNRSKTNEGGKIVILKLIHFMISIAVFYLFWILFRYKGFHIVHEKGYRYNYYVLIVYAVLLFILSRTYNAYLIGYSRLRSLVFGQFLAQLFSILLLYITVLVSWAYFVSPGPFIPMLILQLILDIVWTWCVTLYFFKIYTKKKTLLIYRDPMDKKRFGSIKGKPSERMYHITDEMQYDGSFPELRPYLEGYDAIFVAGVNSRCRNGILKYCKEKSISGFFLPHVGDVIMQEAVHVQSFDSPVLYVSRKHLNAEYAVLKRLFDIVISGTALILFSPVMLITGLAIHFYDGGPALYKQVRLTKDGKRFKILKFRSMRVDAEKDGVARLSTGDKDERITPIGRFVRKCRLDELPQLWNIFIGEMSVVGPRPERPEIAEQYYETMPDFQLRLQVKAGLTGYAQVYGKYNTEPYEKLEFDLLYINHMSFLTDLKLCFATVAILFMSESTEGVKEGRTTAMDSDNEEKSTEK